ncbi:hypothetical protein [Kitasatospora sp. NPDC093102]|uniref:hypothetical protein n=1 Tax=Kitasatospora sp. NPDC093102 TaxID=3155069 RepID=UPI0034473CF1
MVQEAEKIVISSDTHLKIGSLVYEKVDQIDVTGPFEAFSRIPSVAAELRGLQVAQKIQLHLAYAPEPPFDSGTPASAPAAVLAKAKEAVGDVTRRRKQTAIRIADRLHVQHANSSPG